MAGFSRAPSAWKFTFSGLNLKEAADQVPPVQYPLAINIRGLADHSIRTRPGYAFLFDGTGTVEPEPPDIPLTACGTLQDDLNFRWAHNSRVGMFTTATDGEFFYIGADPNNAKRLICVKSTDFGETWALADDTFTAHTNDLASFDCHQVPSDHPLFASLRDTVFIAMQEHTTGRVSLAKFDLSTSTWTFTSNQIVASITTGTFMSCGITVTSTGDIGVLYQTDSESFSATFRNRCGYRYSTDGSTGTTWSAELQVGAWGVERSNVPGRPVSDSAGRVQIFVGNTSLAVSWGEYWVQTVRANHTLSTAVKWRGGSALSQIQSVCCMGDYTTFQSSGTTRIVYVCRMLFDARYTIFETSDNMIAPYQPLDVRDGLIGSTFNGLGGAGYEANYPQVSARVHGTDISFMGNRFSNTVPTYFYHKAAPPPYAPSDLSPSGNADQAGPIFSISGEGIPGQEMAAQVIEVAGELYYVSLRDSAGAGFGLVFNFIRLDQLPTSSAQTIGVWGAACEST